MYILYVIPPRKFFWFTTMYTHLIYVPGMLNSSYPPCLLPFLVWENSMHFYIWLQVFYFYFFDNIMASKENIMVPPLVDGWGWIYWIRHGLMWVPLTITHLEFQHGHLLGSSYYNSFIGSSDYNSFGEFQILAYRSSTNSSNQTGPNVCLNKFAS